MSSWLACDWSHQIFAGAREPRAAPVEVKSREQHRRKSRLGSSAGGSRVWVAVSAMSWPIARRWLAMVKLWIEGLRAKSQRKQRGRNLAAEGLGSEDTRVGIGLFGIMDSQI